MGLQVRVKHALGSRLIELPDRTIDNPITVGRAAGVEVQVPSVSVAARHCVLFRYEGRWAVQDVQAANGTGSSGTFVNGQEVIDPVMLQIGDVISVGNEPSAPTIEVDPAAMAEGRTGWAGDEMTAAPMVPGYAAPAAYSAPGSYGASPGYVSTTGGAGGYNRAAPGRAPAAPAPAGWDTHGAHDNGDHIDLSAAASTPSYAPAYRRKKKPQLSPAAIIIGAVVSIGIISFAAWWVISHQQPTPVAVAPKPKLVDNSNHSDNIFGIGNGTAPDRSNEVTPPAPVVKHPSTPTPDDTDTPAPTPPTPGNLGHTPVTPPSPTPTPPVTPQVASVGKTPGSEEMTPATPGKPTPAAPAPPTDEWQEMQELHNAQSNPAMAIFRFSDYQKHHPTDHVEDMQKYIDDKFDRLWWDRIEQLFKKTDRLIKDAKTVQDQIFDETDKDMKKQEQDQLAKLKATEKLTKETIADKMGYKEEQPPPASGAELAALREKRDNAKYTAWRKTTLNSIINNKGTTDWVADN